eukprot:3214682-Amphidinium_carterae.1
MNVMVRSLNSGKLQSAYMNVTEALGGSVRLQIFLLRRYSDFGVEGELLRRVFPPYIARSELCGLVSSVVYDRNQNKSYNESMIDKCSKQRQVRDEMKGLTYMQPYITSETLRLSFWLCSLLATNNFQRLHCLNTALTRPSAMSLEHVRRLAASLVRSASSTIKNFTWQPCQCHCDHGTNYRSS